MPAAVQIYTVWLTQFALLLRPLLKTSMYSGALIEAFSLSPLEYLICSDNLYIYA